MFKYVRLCLLQVVIVSTTFAAPRSKQRVYISNQATLLHTLEVYVNENEVKKIASGREESFPNSFRTLSYKDKSGTFVPIVNENEMAWDGKGVSDLHVVFTYERPGTLRSGDWKMKKEWRKPEDLEKDWVNVHALSSLEEAREIAEDPTRDPKTLEQIKHFLTHDQLVSKSRENQSKFLDKTFPKLSNAKKEEILNSL